MSEYIGLRQIAKRMGWSQAKVYWWKRHHGFPMFIIPFRNRMMRWHVTDEQIDKWYAAMSERSLEHLRTLQPRKPRPPTRKATADHVDIESYPTQVIDITDDNEHSTE